MHSRRLYLGGLSLCLSLLLSLFLLVHTILQYQSVRLHPEYSASLSAFGWICSIAYGIPIVLFLILGFLLCRKNKEEKRTKTGVRRITAKGSCKRAVFPPEF